MKHSTGSIKGYDYQSQIDYIMRNFNFHNVQRVMSVLGWTWWDSDYTPTIERLTTNARELLESVVTTPMRVKECGGFRVSKIDGKLSLKFIAEEVSIENY